jgi:hypothetical protein
VALLPCIPFLKKTAEIRSASLHGDRVTNDKGLILPSSISKPSIEIRQPMKSKHFTRVSVSSAAGFVLALSAIRSHGAITLDSTGTTDGASSIATTVNIDGSGNASATGYASTGTVSLAFNTSFGFTVDSVATVNTTVGVNYGAAVTGGTIDRAAAGDFGVQDSDLTGPLTNGIDLNEGFIIGIDASTLNPALAWKLTGVLVTALQTPNEQVTIVNRSNTNLSMTVTSGFNGPGTIDVSNLNIIVQGGTSSSDVASIFMSSTTAAGQNFRIGGFQLEAIPEPRAALLGGIGLLALLRRRRSP